MNNIVAKYGQQNFFFFFLGNIFFFVLLAYVLPIHFEENDDVVMLLFSSGKYSGSPEAHLVFINYVYGLFLALLYSSFSNIEWYTIVFAFFHIISLSIISWTIAGSKKIKNYHRILFLGLLYVLEIRLLLLFQFTTTASILALAGIILINSQKDFQRIFGVVLFVVAGLIRFEVALLVLLIAGPIFLKYVNLKNKELVLKPIIFLTIALAFLFLLKYVDYISYQKSDSWRYYQQYNRVRGKINDNPNMGKIIDDLPTNISTVDYELFFNFFPDAKVMDLNRIVLINKKLKDVNFKTKLLNIPASLGMYSRSLLLIIISCGLLFFSIKYKINRLILVFTILSFIFSLCYISLDRSLKYRVYLSALLPLFFVIYSCIESNMIPLPNKLFGICITTFMVVFSAKSYAIMISNNNSSRKMIFSQQNALLNQYFQKNENNLVVYGGNLNIEYYPPFSVSNKFKKGHLFFSGWVTGSPLNLNHFESYKNLVNKDAVFFNRQTYIEMLPKIKMSILLNYGLSVDSEIKLESQDYLIVGLHTHQ